MSVVQAVEQKLRQLKLGRMQAVVASAIAQAEQHQLGYGEFLDELLAEELLGRHENQIRRRLAQAHFPYAATLEQFDWQARPELKRAVMMRYFDSAFVEKAGGLILIGPSGLGKTHLAIAIGTRMAQLGYSVRFLTAQQLANQVLAAPNRAAVSDLLQGLIRCQLLILDEFGYLSVDSQLGPILYEVVSGRYSHGATVITSNKSLTTWGELVGGDSTLMMAILDRLLHQGEVFYLRGASYRLRGKAAVQLDGMPAAQGGLPGEGRPAAAGGRDVG
jgi:DNA replication protein DnaC